MSLNLIATLTRAKKMRVQVYSRERQELEEEIIFGEDLMRLSYGTPAGLWLTARLWVHRWLSTLGGLFYDSRWSKSGIRNFVAKLHINYHEAERGLTEYLSFNDFFARRLKPGARPICPDPKTLISPGDGRLLVFPRIDEDTLSYVKWAPVKLMDLFQQDRALVDRYRGGACAVLRLAPPDYHRFHFPIAGKAGATRSVPGLLHSVHPYALEQKIPVFALNKRTLCSVESEDFGEVLLMEVGALGVGGVWQTYQHSAPVRKGDEKGYFKFGGSTTLLFLAPGRVTFDSDLVANSARGLETIVKMGEAIGRLPAGSREAGQSEA